MAESAELDRDEAREKIRQLVAEFDNLTSARRRSLNEANTRAEYIDKLFMALGWDMHNSAEVTREETVVHRERVDYAFKTRGVPRFLLEAKRPRGSLDDNENIRQATDYAWNQGVDWVVLCNFEELRVFFASHFGQAEPEEWMRAQHPMLMEHLGQFEELAKRRTDQGEFWWELRACSYLEEFSKPKIVYPEIAKESRFTLEVGAKYLNNKCFSFLLMTSIY